MFLVQAPMKKRSIYFNVCAENVLVFEREMFSKVYLSNWTSIFQSLTKFFFFLWETRECSIFAIFHSDYFDDPWAGVIQRFTTVTIA